MKFEVARIIWLDKKKRRKTQHTSRFDKLLTLIRDWFAIEISLDVFMNAFYSNHLSCFVIIFACWEVCGDLLQVFMVVVQSENENKALKFIERRFVFLPV
jgi:hypothetical protein